MNITPISNQQHISVGRINNIQSIKYTPTTKSQVSFGASKPSRVISLLDSSIDKLVSESEFNVKNKLTFKTVLRKAMPEILTPENYLNSGRESKVYRINDRYVAKVTRGRNERNAFSVLDPVQLPNKHFMNLDFYYGEPIIRVGKLEILRNATPSKDYVCCGSTHRSVRDCYAETREYEDTYLPLCSKLPQKSFDKLAMDLKMLNRKKCSGGLFEKESNILLFINPDLKKGNNFLRRFKTKSFIPDVVNPNNLIISEGEFRLVDSLEKVGYDNPNSVYTMLEPLLIRIDPERHAGKREDLLPMRKQIYKKILIAAEKAMLPLDGPIKYEYSDWVLNDILFGKNILEDLREMRRTNVPIAQRVNLIDNIV